jgi:hypothetical protein
MSKTKTERCDCCGTYSPFTIHARTKGKKGDVCDLCKRQPPKNCSICETPHRLDQERCEYCHMQDFTKESEYCLACRCHYKPSKSLRYALVSSRSSDDKEKEDDYITQVIKSIQLCDDCFEKVRIPPSFKPYHKDLQRRNIW